MSCNNLPPDSDIVGLDSALGANFAYPPMPIQIGDTSTTRRIKLEWSVSRYNYHSVDGIRVRLETSNAVDMPSKIFAYTLSPLVAGETVRTASFSHVCSPSDLNDYPEDEPTPGVRPEWFRLDYVDVVLRARTEVHAFIREAASDVYRLKTSLDLNDRIYPAGEIWFGPEPISSSSSSSSSSST
jgi:hypothetical protein